MCISLGVPPIGAKGDVGCLAVLVKEGREAGHIHAQEFQNLLHCDVPAAVK